MKKPNQKKKIIVLFVCTGNTCRSPMAEYIFKRFIKARKNLPFSLEVLSAGIYAVENDSISPLAKQTLSDMGIKNIKHRATPATPEIIDRCDIIICMTSQHKHYLAFNEHKTLLSVGEITGGGDVPDPFLGSKDSYKAVADYLLYACKDILEIILKQGEEL